MQHYRCGRCQAVIGEVAAGPGEPSGLFVDPLIERRLLASVAAHRVVCASTAELEPVTTVEDNRDS
jgi:hypothetical protein